MICERLDTLALRRDVSSLCVLYRIYHEECSEELFDLLTAAAFTNHTELWNGLPAAVFSGLYDRVPSKSASIPTLKAGNVAPLV